MKTILFSVLLAGAALSAPSQISVTVDGQTYQCTGGSGGSVSPMNLCRCRVQQYSSSDWDYLLEKYSPSTNTYVELQKFNANDSNQGAQDKANCEAAKAEPQCYFTN